MEKEKKPYFLGLDIGTDSVGYAATNTEYDLLKFHGEPIWGTTTFEAGSLAEERRMYRTARRRLDRRQQRVGLLTDIFAPDICKIDPCFFIRRKESALFSDDTSHGVKLFEGGLTDTAYHTQYPTIHHLICDLMHADQPRDIRLVYLACSWLVANRGHFLLDAAVDKVRDFAVPYEAFAEYLTQNCGYSLPWDHSFKCMLDNHILTEEQAEDIINHAAYSEDKNRMARWLAANYPAVAETDRKYILHLSLKGFGRLSRKLLTGIMGCTAGGDGEAMSIMDALWQTNDNLMQLLSERYTFREQIDAFVQEYYADASHRKTLSERLSDMYVSNTVKRQIIRTLDVTADVVKAMGCAPEKIFVEMARGGTQDQKGKRTVSRKQQILDLYKKVKNEDVPRLVKELEGMGALADNRLQSDRLFLYYMQMGKCMYTGESIDLSQLATTTYDIDHIYPQSKVQDDSVLNNKVLVLSAANGEKSDRYPIEASVRAKMTGFWFYLKENGLINDEKYRRLTRTTGFSDDELHQFINRQLVETRQSTKVVAQLLKERYPDAEIVYVKAGMVSEFRQEFNMLKCRSVNDLHHAKDAYLNIVVGNVYHEKFTKRWFDTSSKYNISVKKIFEGEQKPYGNLVWRGEEDISKVRKMMGKNAVHLTRYAFCRKGGLFDQMPLKASDGLIPRKADMPTEKYGGYNKPTASYYLLASYEIAGKKDVMFVPIELQYMAQMECDQKFVVLFLCAGCSAESFLLP